MIRLGFIIGSVCCCWLLVPAELSRKIWVQHKTDNLQNWNTRLRIGSVNFPTNLESPIAFAGEDEDFCEIVFPLDDLVEDDEFPPTAAQPKCPDDAMIKTEELSLWINPDNWKPSVSSLVSAATPHMEQLPCQYEDVDLPSTDDLFVILPNKTLIVRSINYGSMVLSIFPRSTWGPRIYSSRYSYRWEKLSQHLVVTGEADATQLIKVTGNSCRDLTGCICGTMYLFHDTCAIVQKKCPTTYTCANPFQPFGHCCKICAYYMEVAYDETRFVYNKFTTVVTTWLEDSRLKLQFHISKRENGTVHVIILQNDENEKNLHTFVTKLQEKIKANDQLAVEEVLLTVPNTNYGQNTWLGPVLYIFLATLLVIASFLMYKSKNTRWFKAIFSRSQLSLGKFEGIQKVHLTRSPNEERKMSHNNTGDDVKLVQEESEEEANSDSEVFIELPIENNQPQLEVTGNLLDISEQ